MRKMILSAMALAMMFTLVGCGDSTTQTTKATTTNVTTSTTGTTTVMKP